MKKILCFFFCFILLSSSCFAYSDESEIVLTRDTYNGVWTSDNVYDFLNRALCIERGFFAYTGDALLKAKAWWWEFLGLNDDDDTQTKDQAVADYVNNNVSVTNNYYNLSSNLLGALQNFSGYLFNLQGNCVQYECIDIFGKNLRVGNSSEYERADMLWLYQAVQKYQDDYYISLSISQDTQNYDSQYFWYVDGSGDIPALRLEPKNNGYLVRSLNYNFPNTNYYSEFVSLSGNNGLNNGNVNFFYYTVNYDLTLRYHNGSETMDYVRSLFALPVLYNRSYGYYGFRYPFNFSATPQKIPICYQRKDYINIYNNGYSADNSGFVLMQPQTNSSVINSTTYDNCPTMNDCQNYSDFRDAINGNNNSVTNADMINYITNIYPNGNDYYTDPNPPGDNGGGSGGGLLDSLVNALGGIGTLIGSILSGILQAVLNIVGAVSGWISSLVTIFTSLIPQSFGSFMNVFYGLIPEPIMNGIIALFSLTCVMAVIRIIRK